MHKQRLAVIIAAAVGIVAFLMPWVSTGGATVLGVALPSYTVSGNGAGGWIPFLLCGAAGALAYLGDDRNKPIEANYVKMVAGAGGAIVLFMLWKTFIQAGPSIAAIGMYLMLLAGIAILAVPFVIKDDGEFSMPTKESITDEFNEMKNS